MFYDDDEAFARAVCLTPGHLFKVEAETFWHALKTKPAIRHVIHHYSHAFLVEVFQSAACHITHTLPQRFARWVLIKSDRAGSNNFPLALEPIADLLAMSPQDLRGLLNQLQRQDLITYDRDYVHICDRAGLERIVCECYDRIRAELLKVGVKIHRRDP